MNARRSSALALALLATLAVAGCSGGGGGGGGGGGDDEGVLVVTVTTPAGMEALSIQVSGPDGYSETLTGSATLVELAPGDYTVTLGDATPAVLGTIIDTIHESTIAGSPATVVDDEDAPATVTVTFAPRNGSGMLYVPDYQGPIHAFAPGALAASGAIAPTLTLGSAGFLNGYAVAFDDLGNLFATRDEPEIGMWSAADLTAGHVPTAIASSANAAVYHSAIPDPTNPDDLWISDYNNNRLVRYAISALTTSSSLAPATVVTYTGFQLAYPNAFDAAGNLWVADYSGDFLARFSATQLAAGGEHAPSVLLASSSGSISTPGALAFDAGGNLWVGNEGTSQLVLFAASSLTASGTPATLRRLGNADGAFDSPRGLAFDNEGGLWVGGQAIDSICRFTPAQIAVPGMPAASIVIGPFSSDVGRIAFNPPPAGLPLPR